MLRSRPLSLAIAERVASYAKRAPNAFACGGWGAGCEGDGSSDGGACDGEAICALCYDSQIGEAWLDANRSAASVLAGESIVAHGKSSKSVVAQRSEHGMMPRASS